MLHVVLNAVESGWRYVFWNCLWSLLLQLAWDRYVGLSWRCLTPVLGSWSKPSIQWSIWVIVGMWCQWCNMVITYVLWDVYHIVSTWSRYFQTMERNGFVVPCWGWVGFDKLPGNCTLGILLLKILTLLLMRELCPCRVGVHREANRSIMSRKHLAEVKYTPHMLIIFLYHAWWKEYISP